MLRAGPGHQTGEAAIMRGINETIGSPIAIICLIAVLLFVIARQIRTKRGDDRSSTPALLQAPPASPTLVPPKAPTTPGSVDIALPKTVDTGQFARYVPFGDKREVIVRRGAALGHRYGRLLKNRRLTVSGAEYDFATYQDILSPPPHQPGQPLHPEADELWQQSDNVPFEQSRNVLLTTPGLGDARRTTTDDASR